MSSLLVFPGQGAQQPGMLHRLPRETVIEASEVLGEDVLLLDSAEALKSTRAVQLCLLIAGVAASRQLLMTADYVAGLVHRRLPGSGGRRRLELQRCAASGEPAR